MIRSKPYPSKLLALALVLSLADRVKGTEECVDSPRPTSAPQTPEYGPNQREHRRKPEIGDLHMLINFLAHTNPELERFSDCQSTRTIATYLASVPCFNIDLDKCSSAVDNKLPPLDFMSIPLKKIHIYKSSTTLASMPELGNTKNRLLCILIRIFHLNTQLLELSNLSVPDFKLKKSLQKPARIRTLVLDNVSGCVIDFVLSKFSFLNSLNFVVTNCSIENLWCLNSLHIVSSMYRKNTTSLSLINLPQLANFYSLCFFKITTLDYVVLRNLGCGELGVVESKMYALLDFLGDGSMASLTLSMEIFTIIWTDHKYGFGTSLDLVSLYIEDIDEPAVYNMLGHYSTTSNTMCNLAIRKLTFSFKPAATLTPIGLESLLVWTDLGFTHIKKIFVNVSNWEDLLPQLQAKKHWGFSMQLLEELKIGEREANLTHAWKENGLVHLLPEITRTPGGGQTICLIPLASYKDWASGEIFPQLTATAAKILPKHKHGQGDEPFSCPICQTAEDEWEVENKAPRVGLLVCGHGVCFECLASLLKLKCNKGPLVVFPVTCPVCRVDITPGTIAFLTQKPEQKRYFVGLPISKYQLKNYLVKRYLLMGFESVGTPPKRRIVPMAPGHKEAGTHTRPDSTTAPPPKKPAAVGLKTHPEPAK
ncbi:hypothetical protein NEDG_00519 [Nematocida displodere]|uniref:RING-type domain-containing protein n=1 Tax=Nematocida displodere TaxID=1805483 RepID=A0A177ECC6_9MICR|nr:hypothetical protein NEDG_00519 [Nematocida displodere]